jgi:hypothetical protein
MNLKISAKQIGRKHPLIDNTIIEIEDIGPHPTLKDLLFAVVAQQVHEYNGKPLEKSLLPFLDAAAIEGQANTGKVGFGSIYNANKADVVKAQQSAIQAFQDGMFVVFAGEEQLPELTHIISLTPDTVITFIRLSFLAGSYW